MAPSNETEKAIINLDEYTRLLQLLDEKKSKDFSNFFHYLIEPKLKMMIQLMYHSGLRVSNIINLKVGNVDFSKGW